MSRGKIDILLLLKQTVASFTLTSAATVFYTAMFTQAYAQEASAPLSNPAETPQKSFTPPPMFGTQNIAAPDRAKAKMPDKSKLAPSARSFSEAVREAHNLKDGNGGEKKKTHVKSRKHIVDVQLAVWGRNAELAESLAHESARKIAGARDRYLVKDISFVQDDKRVICLIRINFTDEIPENWYMESEVVSGFGKNKEKAYDNAILKAAGRVDMVNNSDWAATDSALKNSTDQGVIPFAYSFEGIGSEIICKIYFRYFKSR